MGQLIPRYRGGLHLKVSFGKDRKQNRSSVVSFKCIPGYGSSYYNSVVHGDLFSYPECIIIQVIADFPILT